MAAAPPDLSTCERCHRPVPPTTSPEFAHWTVVKAENGRVRGMRCPNCQAETASKPPGEGDG
jgi:hypothetical protein